MTWYLWTAFCVAVVVSGCALFTFGLRLMLQADEHREWWPPSVWWYCGLGAWLIVVGVYWSAGGDPWAVAPAAGLPAEATFGVGS